MLSLANIKLLNLQVPLLSKKYVLSKFDANFAISKINFVVIFKIELNLLFNLFVSSSLKWYWRNWIWFNKHFYNCNLHKYLELTFFSGT